MAAGRDRAGAGSPRDPRHTLLEQRCLVCWHSLSAISTNSTVLVERVTEAVLLARLASDELRELDQLYVPLVEDA